MPIRDLILSQDADEALIQLKQQWTEMANRVLTPDGVVIEPKSTATPAKAGDMVFELTNNTTLKIKVRGSDGTVRAVSLTLA